MALEPAVHEKKDSEYFKISGATSQNITLDENVMYSLTAMSANSDLIGIWGVLRLSTGTQVSEYQSGAAISVSASSSNYVTVTKTTTPTARVALKKLCDITS